MPQILIQAYFIIQTSIYRGKFNLTIVISLVSSIFSVVSKSISEDTPLIKKKEKLTSVEEMDAVTPMKCTNKCKCNCLKCACLKHGRLVMIKIPPGTPTTQSQSQLQTSQTHLGKPMGFQLELARNVLSVSSNNLSHDQSQTIKTQTRMQRHMHVPQLSNISQMSHESQVSQNDEFKFSNLSDETMFSGIVAPSPPPPGGTNRSAQAAEGHMHMQVQHPSQQGQHSQANLNLATPIGKHVANHSASDVELVTMESLDHMNSGNFGITSMTSVSDFGASGFDDDHDNDHYRDINIQFNDGKDMDSQSIAVDLDSVATKHYYLDYGRDPEFFCFSCYKWCRCECVSFFWLSRVFFRLFDVSLRIGIYLAIWMLFEYGGFAVFVIIVIDFIYLAFFTIANKELSVQ